MSATVRFAAELFLWADGSWHFVRLPDAAAEEVRDLADEAWHGPRRGFGSVKVRATIGVTSWGTSVFPEKESGSFLLPVKKAVRAAEGIVADDLVPVELEVEPDLGSGVEEGTP